MRTRLILCVMVVISIMMLVVGLYGKRTYKDLNDETEPLANFYVGMLSEELVERQVELMKSVSRNSYAIVAVRCKDTTDFLFSCLTQKVEVVKVFKGEGIQVGQEMTIAKDNGLIEFDGYGKGKHSINMGFVNEMKPESVYLVFVDREIEEKDLYVVGTDKIISPIFCYDDIDNKIGIDENPDEYVCYTTWTSVKDNEYFFESQKAYDIWLDFKEEILNEYSFNG